MSLDDRIHAVLLVPAEGDPHGLLGDPESTAWKCGARPPMVDFRQCRYGHTSHGGWGGEARSCSHPSHPVGRLRPLLIHTNVVALVLAWDGEVLGAGCDRFRRVTGIDVERRVATEVLDGPWASAIVRGHKVIRLDADGREVKDE